MDEVERIELDGVPEDGFVADDEVLIGAPTQDEADESRETWQEEVAASEVPEAESFESFKDRKREELGGMGLAWWEDNSLFAGLGVLGKVLDSAVDMTESIETMFEVGLPKDILTVEVPLSVVSGPLILSGLQVLGLFEPRLRPQIEEVMRTITSAQPEPTEEEQALLNEFGTKAAEVQFAKFVNDIEASGGKFISADQLGPQEGGGVSLN